MLSVIWREYPDELEADLQEYFNLNIEQAGETFSVRHCAVCTTQLPPQSRTKIAIDPAAEWGWQEHLLASELDALHLLLWQNGGAKRNRPKPIERPTRKQPKEEIALPVDTYAARLSRPRKEVDDG
jgi:hypothetical protein